MVLRHGAYAAMLTMWAAARVLDFDAANHRSWRLDGLYLLTGFAAGFTAVNELPAAAFAAAVFVLVLSRSPVRGGLLKRLPRSKLISAIRAPLSSPCRTPARGSASSYEGDGVMDLSLSCRTADLQVRIFVVDTMT